MQERKANRRRDFTLTDAKKVWELRTQLLSTMEIVKETGITQSQVRRIERQLKPSRNEAAKI